MLFEGCKLLASVYGAEKYLPACTSVTHVTKRKELSRSAENQRKFNHAGIISDILDSSLFGFSENCKPTVCHNDRVCAGVYCI